MGSSGESSRSLALPIAIVIAGGLIGLGVFFAYRTHGTVAQTTGSASQGGAHISIPPVQTYDHILGSPNAKIVLVEYSDTECPFCKEFHTTLHKIIDRYGASGQVAWVFRDFPIAELHSKAAHEAEAQECAADLGGNSGFWKFTDRIYAVTPSDDKLDPSQLTQIAQDVGLNVSDFTACLASGKHASKVAQSVTEAKAAGATGTPYTVVLFAGETIPIVGSQTYDFLDQLIQTLIGPPAATTTP